MWNGTHANDYKDNLLALIRDLRSEVQKPSLPVVIVGLNWWAGEVNGEYSVAVKKGQEDAVKELTNAVLVTISDLSHNYHMDPVAQLVVGDRVATALGFNPSQYPAEVSTGGKVLPSAETCFLLGLAVSVMALM